MRTHSGEKPFRCEQCNYSCTQAQNLKRHLLNHTGEKPLTCKQCIFSCKHSNGLKYHMLSHTGKKPIACKQCIFSCKLLQTQSAEDAHEKTQCKNKCLKRKQLLNMTIIMCLLIHFVLLTILFKCLVAKHQFSKEHEQIN